MTSARQNAPESTIDRRGLDLHCEVVWSKKGKVDLMAGAASRKREPSQLGGLTLQAVLVESQTSDFAGRLKHVTARFSEAAMIPRILSALLLLRMASPSWAQSLDLLIRNGSVLDVSGSRAKEVDIGIRGDRVVSLEKT
jgi:hypothetical protein